MQSTDNPQPEHWSQPPRQGKDTGYVASLGSFADSDQAADLYEVATAAAQARDITDDADQPVYWQAKEYIERSKDAVWFIWFGLVIAILIGLASVMQAWTFMALIVVMAIALIIYVRRPPAIINYTLSGKGLYVNEQLYPLSDFKSFGVIQGEEEYSIMLIPRKRFRPGVSVYFPEESGEAIVDMLGTRLPMRDIHLDIIDKLVKKLRI